MQKKIFNFFSEYKFFSVIIFIEILFIFWAAILLFFKPADISLKLADIVNNGSNCYLDENGNLVIEAEKYPSGEDTLIYSYTDIFLRPGAYSIKVDYTAELPGAAESGWSGGSTVKLCSVSTYSDKIPYQVISDNVTLNIDCRNNEKTLWVNSITNCNDLKLSITYHGFGNILIKSITIKERLIFRFTRLLCVLIIVTAFNFFFYVFFMENRVKDKDIIFGLLSVILFSNLPVFFRMLFSAHDLDFHLARIGEIAQGISAGNWLIKIQPDMINGYGFATPLFYPQLFLYIPAILYVLGFPLQTSYQIFVFLINTSSCLISYYCFYKITKDKRLSLIGSCLYTLSIFKIIEIYLGATIGENLSMIFFPLIIYGIYIIYTTEGRIPLSKCLPLIIGVTGIIESHLVSCLFTGIFLFIFVMFNIKKTFEPNRLAALVKSVIITFMLNLWFIVPFLDSMDMDILVNAEHIIKLQPSGIYLIQLFNLLHYGSGLNSPVLLLNDMPLTPGVGLLFGIFLFLYIISNRTKLNVQYGSLYKLGKLTCIFSIIAILFSLELFPWDELINISPKLIEFFCLIEFPWRFLSVAAPFAAYCSVAALKLIKEKNTKLYKLSIVSMVFISVLGISSFYTDLAFTGITYPIYSSNSIDEFALGGSNDYQLSGTDLSLCNDRSLHIYDENLTVNNYSYEYGVTELECVNNNTDGFAKVGIPLFAYPGYRAYDKDSMEQMYIEAGNNKIIMVYVPAGYSGTIIVKYFEKPIWRIAELISLLTLIFLAAVYPLLIKKNKYSLKSPH